MRPAYEGCSAYAAREDEQTDGLSPSCLTPDLTRAQAHSNSPMRSSQ